MATQLKIPGTWASDSAGGLASWTTPSNASADDGTNTTTSGLTVGNASHYLKGTNCGFDAFTSGATINSVTVRVERLVTSGSATIKDQQLKMFIAGVVDSQNLADTATAWTGSAVVVTYTFNSGLPTAAQILGSDFGFVLNCAATGSGGAVAAVDYGSIEIDYTAAPSVPTFDTAVTDSGGNNNLLTIGPVVVVSNPNRYLVVGVSIDAPGGVLKTISSVSFAGTGMTFLGAQTAANNDRVELWGLAAPTTAGGDVTVLLSSGAAADCIGTAAVFYNVHQTVPTEGFNSATAATGTTATIACTSLANNCLIVDVVGSTDTTLTVGSGQTSRGSAAGTIFHGLSTEGVVTPPGATTMSWTAVTEGETWISAALALRPYDAPSVAITGTAITTQLREADIVAGGKTAIITLTGDTWVASGATFDAQRQNIINGMDSAQAEAGGWDAKVKGLEVVGAVVRTSDTVVTITLTASAAFDITATETITVTIPATALTGGYAVVASPTFRVVPTFNVVSHLGGLRVGQESPPRAMAGQPRAGLVPAGMRERPQR